MSSPTEQVTFLKQAIITILGWSWLEYLTAVGRFFHQAWGRNVKDGMYEVLSYETTLELKNRAGEFGRFYQTTKSMLFTKQHNRLSRSGLGGWRNSARLQMFARY